MARAGLELALADLLAQARGEPLSRFLGGVRDRIPVGVSLGIQPDVGRLLERVDRYVGLGYQRIKLKIKPGWDLAVVAEVRRHYPEVVLSVDANAAYTLADRKHLKELDAFGLLMIEQPLDDGDLLDHAALQRELETPICLDESITGLRAARQALDLGSCRIVNMKVGRVGGYSQALAIQRLCVDAADPALVRRDARVGRSAGRTTLRSRAFPASICPATSPPAAATSPATSSCPRSP